MKTKCMHNQIVLFFILKNDIKYSRFHLAKFINLFFKRNKTISIREEISVRGTLLISCIYRNTSHFTKAKEEIQILLITKFKKKKRNLPKRKQKDIGGKSNFRREKRSNFQELLDVNVCLKWSTA